MSGQVPLEFAAIQRNKWGMFIPHLPDPHKPETLTYGTFGIYRWLLATLVLQSHLGPTDNFNAGSCALWAFFVLSGYTSSYILDNRYLDLQDGVRKYYINRALRIYPLYWAVAFASIPLIIYFPDITKHLSGGMTLPVNSGYWLLNFTIFGLAPQVGGLPLNHMLVPVGWSLAVEMQWWCFMPFVVRDLSRRPGFLKSSALLFALILIWKHSLDLIYLSVLCGMVNFALGLAVYLYIKRRRKTPSATAAASLAVLFVVLFLFGGGLALFHERTFGFVLIVTAATIYYLSAIDNMRMPPLIQRIDYWLGRLAYPIFLLNFVAGVLVNALFPSLEYKSWGLFFASWLLAHAIGILLILAIETPVERLRRHYKY